MAQTLRIVAVFGCPLAAVAIAAFAAGAGHPTVSWLTPASTTALRGAPALEVVFSDVVIAQGARAPARNGPGEEVVYVIEGSTIHREAGRIERVYRAGDALVISTGAGAASAGGDETPRAIVLRVQREDAMAHE